MTASILGDILGLLGVFLHPDFATSPEARRLGLGQVGAPAGLTRLPPAGYAADYLVARHENLPGRSGYLTTLEFLWATPLPLSVAEIEPRFGPGRLVCGTDNEEEDRFEIELHGHPLRGLLVVEFDAGSFGDTLATRGIRLVRIAPPPFGPADAAGDRIVLLDDLGAAPDETLRPFSVVLGPLFTPDDLMARLEPVLAGTLPNHISEGEAPLAFTFHPRRLAHLEPETAVRLIDALAPLYGLRDALRDLEAGDLAARELRGRVDMEALPALFRQETNRLLKEGRPTSGELRARVSDLLERQGAEMLALEGYRRLSGAWRHLAALNAALEATPGRRLEVCPTTADQLEMTLRTGLVEEEHFHPEGAPPLVVVLGPSVVGALDPARQRGLVDLTATIETPLWFDAEHPFRPEAVADRPDAFQFPPLRKVIRRVETQFLAHDDVGAIEAAVAAALAARHPGAAPRVRLTRTPGAPDRLAVEMEWPVPGGPAPLVFRYDANWRDYR